MRATLVIREITELVTSDVSSGLGTPAVIRDAVLAADGQRIVYAGAQAGAPVFEGVEQEIAAQAAVLPGFVDSHTHLVWAGDRAAEYALRAEGRSYEEIAAAGGGIRSTVRATTAADVDTLHNLARARARRMLAHGTTTVEVKSGYGLQHDAELRQLLAAEQLAADADVPDVVATYLPLHALPEGDREQFIESVLQEGLPRNAPHARFVDAFCEQGAYSVEECERLFSAARRHGLPARVHAEQRSRSGGAQLAARCGAASADHLEHADDSDLRALAAAGTVATLLPGASMVLGGPPPPGRRALEAGCTLAVATDCNPGTCNSESIPLMLSLAVATAGLTPAQALVAATAGGATALRLHDRGVLRAGLRCDAVVLRSPQWLDVAYHLGGDVIALVVRAGQVAVSGSGH